MSIRSIRSIAAVVGACISTLCAVAAPEVIVKLAVAEEAGYDRVREPMTMGVPLPEGRVSDAARLGLQDAAGKAIPCQVTEVTRWLDGKSIKWVHLTWSQSLKAGATDTLSLMLLDAPQPPQAGSLKAEEKDNTVTVQTGFVKFTVRGAGFDGIAAAWFDPAGGNQFADANQVIGAGGGSTVLSPDNAAVAVEEMKFKVDGAPKPYLSTQDAQGKVMIEEQGPRRVVVKATGRHLDAAGKPALDYIVRFYAYADSPVVRVSHTFVGAQGEQPADMLFLSGLNLGVATRLAGGQVAFGTEKQPVAAKPGARLLQRDSDHYALTSAGAQIAAGGGKSGKPLTLGWVDLRKGRLGLAAGIKWFWQMCPKALEVTPEGVINLGLYPADASQPLEVYMGQSRTHYLTLFFHDGQADLQALNAVFAAQNRPLQAWASPRYYCRDTHAFGYAVESDPALFGADAEKMTQHDAKLLDSLKQGVKAIDLRRQTLESYGIYAWGDLYHWQWENQGKAPYNTQNWRYSFEGNYYDYPHVMFQGFVRTGDKLYLERFIPNAIQVGDVHTVNYHPKKELIGACRYCPPRNFVATDDGAPYVSAEFNHFKSQCVFAYYYLTGDRRSLDHCEMQANNVLNNRAADRGWAARGVGAQLGGLWNAYELTRDAKYLARMKEMAGKAMAQFRTGKYSVGGDFMWGIANEGLCYYYWVTGDPAVIETFKEGYPKCRAATAHPNMALGLAMTYRVTGDESFREMAWKAIAKEKADLGPHGIGQTFRSTHFALFFLSDASKGWKPFVQ
jgi:hypothetical protein